ncbi:MAG: hypothetical protein KKC20_24895 [Proteobacteria bacterium]|jgi:hypothetical protein|nr:hypothetical protein [Pseudomonadota bacterium]
MNKTTESIIPLNERERKQRLVTRLIAGAVIIVVMCVLIFTGLLGKAHQAIFPTPTPIPDPATQAVEAGVTAYATFEYNEDGNTDAWAERICAVSTEVTCEYVKSQVAPEMVKAATTAKRGMSVLSAQALMKVDENPSTDIAQQIWAVKYSVDFWNGETVEKTDYVIITQEDGVWKFDNFVPLPQEILDQLYGPKLTPQAPTQETPQP